MSNVSVIGPPKIEFLLKQVYAAHKDAIKGYQREIQNLKQIIADLQKRLNLVKGYGTENSLVNDRRKFTREMIALTGGTVIKKSKTDEGKEMNGHYKKPLLVLERSLLSTNGITNISSSEALDSNSFTEKMFLNNEDSQGKNETENKDSLAHTRVGTIEHRDFEQSSVSEDDYELVDQKKISNNFTQTFVPETLQVDLLPPENATKKRRVEIDKETNKKEEKNESNKDNLQKNIMSPDFIHNTPEKCSASISLLRNSMCYNFSQNTKLKKENLCTDNSLFHPNSSKTTSLKVRKYLGENFKNTKLDNNHLTSQTIYKNTSDFNIINDFSSRTTNKRQHSNENNNNEFISQKTSQKDFEDDVKYSSQISSPVFINASSGSNLLIDSCKANPEEKNNVKNNNDNNRKITTKCNVNNYDLDASYVSVKNVQCVKVKHNFETIIIDDESDIKTQTENTCLIPRKLNIDGSTNQCRLQSNFHSKEILPSNKKEMLDMELNGQSLDETWVPSQELREKGIICTKKDDNTLNKEFDPDETYISVCENGSIDPAVDMDYSWHSVRHETHFSKECDEHEEDNFENSSSVLDFDERLEDKSPNYKYKINPVRKREDRKKLEGHDCKSCKEYYRSTGLNEQQIAERLKECSRHRHKYVPPQTPDHFWSIDFPNTQESKERGYVKPTQYRPLQRRRRRPLTNE